MCPNRLYLWGMLLYNVTIGIDREIADEWLAWMKAKHIPDILATGKFVDYRIYVIMHDEGEPTVSYSVQYFANTLDDVSAYLEQHEPVLGEELRALQRQARGFSHVTGRSLAYWRSGISRTPIFF